MHSRCGLCSCEMYSSNSLLNAKNLKISGHHDQTIFVDTSITLDQFNHDLLFTFHDRTARYQSFLIAGCASAMKYCASHVFIIN